VVDHSRAEYARKSGAKIGQLLAEFDFRYSNRVKLGVSDAMRAAKIVEGAKSKRLQYRRPKEGAVA
jgi:hypothetical protein